MRLEDLEHGQNGQNQKETAQGPICLTKGKHRPGKFSKLCLLRDSTSGDEQQSCR